MRTRQIHSISVLPLLLLFFAVAPAAMAQLVGLPEYGVLLSGTPENPVVLNQSPHRILAFTLHNVKNGDHDLMTCNQVGLNQLTRGNAGPSGPGIPPGGTSLSLAQVAAPQVRGGGDAGPLTDIAEATTLDSVLFDDGLFVGPDLSHSYDSITAKITAEGSVDSILLSAKTDDALATAWEQIKQIAETPLVPPTPPPTRAPGTIPESRCVPDPNSLRQSAMQLLSVRDRLGEKAAVAQAARAYPKIHKE